MKLVVLCDRWPASSRDRVVVGVKMVWRRDDITLHDSVCSVPWVGGVILSTLGWGGQVAFKYAFLMTAVSACKVRRRASNRSKIPGKEVVGTVIAVVVAGAPPPHSCAQKPLLA